MWSSSETSRIVVEWTVSEVEANELVNMFNKRASTVKRCVVDCCSDGGMMAD